MNKPPFFVLVLLCVLCAHSQTTLLNVANGTTLHISENTTFRVGDLTLLPSQDIVISNTSLIQSSTPIRLTSDDQSIAKVFTFSEPQVGFRGGLRMYYKYDELNEVTEEELHIATLARTDDTDWNIDMNSLRNSAEKWVSCNFTEPTSLGQITMGTEYLSVELPEGATEIRVYPNPTRGVLMVASKTPTDKRIYDSQGLMYLESSDRTLNLQEIPSGIYLLETTEIDSQKRHYFKVIKL
jgi:hypothetical protein